VVVGQANLLVFVTILHDVRDLLSCLWLQDQLGLSSILVHPICVENEKIIIVVVNHTAVTDNGFKVFDVVRRKLKALIMSEAIDDVFQSY
jgi:hypothetical protein